MQTENSIKKNINSFFSTLGKKKVDSIFCDFFFYELEIPSLLLENDETTIDTLNKPIQ